MPPINDFNAKQIHRLYNCIVIDNHIVIVALPINTAGAL